MKRRSVLQALGVFTLAPLWVQVSALAQGSGKSKKITSTVPVPPKKPLTKEGAELVRVGLPPDWKFELPKQWKSDGGVLAKGPSKRVGSGLFVSGVQTESTGSLKFASAA